MATLPQLSVRAVGWLVAAVAGAESVTAAGMATMVVKLPVSDQADVPLAFVALTRQK